MNGRIAVLCPTRDRVAGLHLLADSVARTSTLATVISCGDEDTEHLYGQRPDIVQHFVPRAAPANKANYLVAIEQDYDVYGVLPDDSFVACPGWDHWLLATVAKFPGGIGVVSASHNGQHAVNFPFVTRRWIDTLGWLACPDTTNYCWDTILEMLGEATALVYAGDNFVVHHENPDSKNVEPFTMDCVQFLHWCVTKRGDAVKRLREAMA
jgi:hypothetical protein